MGSIGSVMRWLVPAICSLLCSWSVAPRAVAQSQSQFADRAFWHSKEGQAIAEARGGWSSPSKLHSKWSAVWRKSSEQQRAFLSCVSKEWENQVRFNAAVGALRLHYAIAACQMGLELQTEAQGYVEDQVAVQEELIELGGRVDDITALKRSAIDLQDRKLELESQLSQLREKLSLLVGSELACSYRSHLMCAPTPDLHERCEYETWAIDQRIELLVLRYVRGHLELLNEEGIELVSALSSFPGGLQSLWGPVERPSLFGHKPSADQLAKRSRGLDRWIATRSDQIRVETGAAYTSKATAWERWRLAVKKSDTIAERFERLQGLADLQGNLTQQVQVKLEYYRARAQEIERWLEWHQGDCDLQQATGRIGFWNLESAACVPLADSSVKDE